MYKCDKNQLLQIFDRFPMPSSAKTDITNLKPSKKRKICRNYFPSAKIQTRMRDCEQNSQEWHQYRDGTKIDSDDEDEEGKVKGGSYGGSGDAALLGLDHYSSNVTAWLVDSGRKCRMPPQKYSDQMPMDLGHHQEPHSLKVYEIVMGANVYQNGLILHPLYPFRHISQDGFAEFKDPENNKYNKYVSLAGAPKRILVEIKNPLYSLYTTKDGSRAHIPPHYLVQLNAQTDCFQEDVDFVVEYRCKPDMKECPPLVELNGDNEPTGRFLITEVLITRYFRNQLACNRGMLFLKSHMKHLTRNDVFVDYTLASNSSFNFLRGPAPNEYFWLYFMYCDKLDRNESDEESKYDNSKETRENVIAIKLNKRIDLDQNVLQFENEEYIISKDGIVTIVLNEDHQKLFQCDLYDFTLIGVYPPKELPAQLMPDVNILPLKRIKYFITPPEGQSKPIDKETESFVGKIEVEIEHYFEQKPLKVTMKSLIEKDNKATELNAIPPSDSSISRENVKNPLIESLLKENPDQSVQDVIWNFALKGAKNKK